MKAISITSENGETFSSVSNYFIDYHMTQANGEFVKIYLYMVRLLQANHPVSIQDIADHFQCTQKDVCRAIRYWADRDLIRLEYNQNNELIGITITRPVAPEPQEESERNSGMELLSKPAYKEKVTPIEQLRALPPLTKVLELPDIPEKQPLSSMQLRAYEKDKEMENILYQFEMYCGHSPTQSEFQTLLYIYDQLHFPAELLEYLIEYCVSLEHTSHRYMEKVAINWYTEGIQSAEQAKQKTAAYHALNNAITKELGLSRVLTPTELKYINTWTNDYSFQQDIIVEACQRASAANKINFRYINSILTSWHDNDVQSLADIQKLDQAYSAEKKTVASKQTVTKKVQAFNDFNQREYDDQELENFFIKEIQKKTNNS